MKTLGMNRFARMAALLGALALVVSCAGAHKELPRPPAGYAQPPRATGAFSALEASVRERGGPDASGFMLLDRSEEGLRWRLALIDHARHTLDLQYFLWYGDAVGVLMMQRVMQAADRGVRVRLIVDDLLTFGLDVDTAKLDDYPNIEVRLFNPWHYRPLFGRGVEMAEKMERLNHRMHNKLIVADNQVAILGGRNIGDEYFGMNEPFNFHDLDVVGVGPVARQASRVFDNFWNSEMVASASALRPPFSIYDLDPILNPVERRLQSHQLKLVGTEPRRWDREIEGLPANLSIGTSRVMTDLPDRDSVAHHMPKAVRELMSTATQEVLLVNAYIILDEKTLECIRGLTARGVRVRILTNSLASQDVPAVNSHYKHCRKPSSKPGWSSTRSGPTPRSCGRSSTRRRPGRSSWGCTRRPRGGPPAGVHRLHEPRPPLHGVQQRDGRHDRERRFRGKAGKADRAQPAAGKQLEGRAGSGRAAALGGRRAGLHRPAGAELLAAGSGLAVHALPEEPLLTGRRSRTRHAPDPVNPCPPSLPRGRNPGRGGAPRWPPGACPPGSGRSRLWPRSPRGRPCRPWPAGP